MVRNPLQVARHTLVGPGLLVGAVAAIGAIAVGGAGGPVLGLSFLGALVGLVGVVGVYNASEQLAAAANTGVREVDADLVESDSEIPYGTSGLALAWGAGTFGWSWVVLLAI